MASFKSLMSKATCKNQNGQKRSMYEDSTQKKGGIPCSECKRIAKKIGTEDEDDFHIFHRVPYVSDSMCYMIILFQPEDIFSV